MRYTSWGEVRSSSTTSSSLADYTFTGQYSYMDDPSTTSVTEGFGLMFYNARMYDPALGRFTSADSIVPAGVQGWDRYAYVANNPIKYTDPSGHQPCNQQFGCGDGGTGNGGNSCDLDCWRDRHPDEDNGCTTYHVGCGASLIDAYNVGWENFGQAWSIFWNPDASYVNKMLASYYMTYWGGAHIVGIAGGAIVLRQGLIVAGWKAAQVCFMSPACRAVGGFLGANIPSIVPSRPGQANLPPTPGNITPPEFGVKIGWPGTVPSGNFVLGSQMAKESLSTVTLRSLSAAGVDQNIATAWRSMYFNESMRGFLLNNANNATAVSRLEFMVGVCNILGC